MTGHVNTGQVTDMQCTQLNESNDPDIGRPGRRAMSVTVPTAVTATGNNASSCRNGRAQGSSPFERGSERRELVAQSVSLWLEISRTSGVRLTSVSRHILCHLVTQSDRTNPCLSCTEYRPKIIHSWYSRSFSLMFLIVVVLYRIKNSWLLCCGVFLPKEEKGLFWH